MNASRQRWTLGIRLLHWLTAIALAVQIAVAFGPMDRPGMVALTWLPLHMSIGVTILVIIVLRLCWRIFTKAPVRRISRLARVARAFIHISLYAVILAVLITGWLGYRPMPFMPPARIFGGLPVPLAPSAGGLSVRAFAIIHAKLVWILLGLIGIHVIAALAHVALFRDGVMRGISLGRSDKPSRQ